MPLIPRKHSTPKKKPGIFKRLSNGFSAFRAAYFDAADSNRLNEDRNAKSSNQDADSLNSPHRSIIRDRCRMEAANNPYFKAIMETYANDTIGTGARLTMATKDVDWNAEVQAVFEEWRKKADAGGRQTLDEMANQAVTELFQSGDALYQKVIDRTEKGPVKLKLLSIESDRLTTPLEFVSDTEEVRDGIRINTKTGNVIEYYVLKGHPGRSDTTSTFNLADFDIIKAADMIHLFRADRPGQTRGMPWLGPSLTNFQNLRDFTEATLTSAQTAARLSIILSAEGEDVDTDPALYQNRYEEEVGIGTIASMPAGWNPTQLKPEHPIANFSEFKKEILSESARPAGMPFFIIAASSEGLSFAGSKMDGQIYTRHINGTRTKFKNHYYNCVLKVFIEEYRLARRGPIMTLPIEDLTIANWGFDPVMVHADPVKEAKGKQIMRDIGIETFISQCAEAGVTDWKKKLDEKKEAEDYAKKIGTTIGRVPDEVMEQPDDEEEIDETETGESDNEQGTEETSAA